MAKLWTVAKYEFLKSVRRRAFLLSTLGIPLLLAGVMVVAVLASLGTPDERPVGYVDQAGVLAAGLTPDWDDPDDAIATQPFADVAAASAALERGEIQAFYVLGADYLQSRKLQLYYWEREPAEQVRAAFDTFMMTNLLAELPAESRERLIDGNNVTIRSADGRREVGANNFLDFIIPFVIGFFFFFAVMMSGGYLLQVVTDEKENRTMEVTMTSVSPEQLIGGKAVGLIGVALTQLVVWTVTLAAGLAIAAQFVPVLQTARVPWAFLGVAMLYFLPAYVLMAGLMTAVGGVVTDSRQGQQISGILNMLFIVPYFFTIQLFSNPNSPLLVALTLFPTTAFITVVLRWSMTVIPAWQMVVSWLLLAVTAVLSVWASARIFRTGMLRYGQQLSLRATINAVRGQAGQVRR